MITLFSENRDRVHPKCYVRTLEGEGERRYLPTPEYLQDPTTSPRKGHPTGLVNGTFLVFVEIQQRKWVYEEEEW